MVVRKRRLRRRSCTPCPKIKSKIKVKSNVGLSCVALVLALLVTGCALPQVVSAPEVWGVPADSGSGRRIVYRKPTQQVWLIEANGAVIDAFHSSGRLNIPRPGTYEVFRKINPGSSGSLRLPYFVGFAYGSSTDIGFHGIPLHPSGRPIQRDDQLGTPLSHGCVRLAQDKALEIWNWADYGTTVVVVG